jgi:hypothetical protein
MSYYEYGDWSIITELVPHNAMLVIHARKGGKLIKEKTFGYTEEEAVDSMKAKIDEQEKSNAQV